MEKKIILACEVISEESSKNGRLLTLICHCGNVFKRLKAKCKYQVKTGGRLSCGCLVGKGGTHHLSKHPLHPRYRAMISRCTNPNNKSFCNYGGRGIKVCDRWMEYGGQGFLNFVKDLGDCPPKYELDRIDVNGDYEPSNCRWVDKKTSALNKRPNPNNNTGIRGVSWNGSTFTVLFGDRYLGVRKTLLDAAALRKSEESRYYDSIQE